MPALKKRHLDFYTVTQVAELLRVGKNTVVRWCRDGDMRSHRMPKSTMYFMTRQDIVEFLRVWQLDGGRGRFEGETVYKVLAVGCEPAWVDRLAALLPAADNYRVEAVYSHYSLQEKVESCYSPEAVILDHVMGRRQAAYYAERLHSKERTAATRFLGLANENDDMSVAEGLYEAWWRRPVEPEVVAAKLREMGEAWAKVPLKHVER